MQTLAKYLILLLAVLLGAYLVRTNSHAVRDGRASVSNRPFYILRAIIVLVLAYIAYLNRIFFGGFIWLIYAVALLSVVQLIRLLTYSGNKSDSK